jgi:hypothetical protein
VSPEAQPDGLAGPALGQDPQNGGERIPEEPVKGQTARGLDDPGSDEANTSVSEREFLDRDVAGKKRVQLPLG